ncbi:MAG: T9SS type A sorting domain-containing protein [Bacteroidales bacterium]|nr:T9SS type A sorting domain-containing protein [Bacteroidales bacterium]
MKTKQLLLLVFVAMFAAITVNAAIPVRKGWWKFDDSADMLKATIGAPLDSTGNEHFSANGPVDGNLAIADPRWKSLKMNHGITAGNGGGVRVNEYTIQFDVMVPDLTNWHAFIQTGANEGDGDLFIKKGTGIVGLTALNWSTNAIVPGQWYRVVESVKCGEFARVYVDGQLWVEGKLPAIDSRFSLSQQPLIFGDDDGEDDLIYCADLSFWDVALTEAEVVELGNATTVSGTPDPVGLWQFDDPADLTKATIGSPLVLSGTQTSVAGPVDGNMATTVPLGSYLTMNHGIAPNLGGAMVNDWSLQVDFSVPAINKWYSFFQTGDPTGDADLFVAKSASGARLANAIGTATTAYSTNVINANQWYRMLVTVQNGVFFKVYLDGQLWLDAAGQPVDGRWALDQTLLMFQDNDGDDADINCSEIAIWNSALTADQVLALGDANKVTSGIAKVFADNNSDLSQNYPNPVVSTTTFNYNVRANGNVTFRVLDQTGREMQKVNIGAQTPGQYKWELNASNMKSGMYYVQMMNNNRISTKKLVVVK